MDKRRYILKWDSICESKKQNGFRSIRISPDCIPDLFLGVDNDNNRCLLLFLPYHFEIKLKKPEKEKLKIEFINTKNIILIKLTDSDFIDLFDDLIISLLFDIMMLSDPKEYSKRLLLQFYKWSTFFENIYKYKLSVEEIRGLWGELFVLNELIEKEDSGHINYILEAWKGPYDTSNDFVFDDINLEIKTKDESRDFVKISSEFQLENEYEKGLELVIITLKGDLSHGESLKMLIKKVIEHIRYKFGDLSILYHALRQKGLTVENSAEYDNYRFCIMLKKRFDCTMEGFPKLTKANIPLEITNLKYMLRTSSLKKFLIEENKY